MNRVLYIVGLLDICLVEKTDVIAELHVYLFRNGDTESKSNLQIEHIVLPILFIFAPLNIIFLGLAIIGLDEILSCITIVLRYLM